ncbi:MAG: rhomboid family intramembrane serine protease [Defluviitaleaceae bacterium]|nr:rhomboid family intramembrane serine protease [Defluviitaleaceae bacterium]MCL2273898.1 rhomboid family intramembrane serine protease [Defluviitaleaceae bacterium]
MNPIKRIQYNAPVILTFALLSLLVLGLQQVFEPITYQRLFSVFRASPTDPLTYWRMFSHVFGHANYAHFIANFMIILLIGPLLEERYGGKWLVIMMAVTALVTGLLHIMVSDGAKLGASGIVFMLILLGSFTNLQRGRVPLTLILVLAIFIGREVVAAIGADADNNIAYLSHIVGGLCGAGFGFFANKEGWRGDTI